MYNRLDVVTTGRKGQLVAAISIGKQHEHKEATVEGESRGRKFC